MDSAGVEPSRASESHLAGNVSRTLSTPTGPQGLERHAIPSAEGSSSTMNKCESRPLRHMESFSKRNKHAWYYMPWATECTNPDAIIVAPGPHEFEVTCQIGEGLTSIVYLARIKRSKELAPGKDNKCVFKVSCRLKTSMCVRNREETAMQRCLQQWFFDGRF